MKTQALTAVVSLSLLAGFGGKRPEESATAAESPTPITSVGLRIGLSQKGKELALGSQGTLVFNSKDGACHIGVSVDVTGNRKALDAAVSRHVKEILGRLKHSDSSRQEFTTGFFQISGESVARLVSATVEQLLGKYEFKSTGTTVSTVAPLNEKNIGFVLPVGETFRGPVKIQLDLSPADDTGTNPLCRKINAFGFRVASPKQDA